MVEAQGEAEPENEPEQRIAPIVIADAVLSLSVWVDRLISGHCKSKLRVWNVMTGTCDQVLAGHKCDVNALAVCGPRLVSGSDDGSIKVWAMNATAPWTWERTLQPTGQRNVDKVWSLLGWNGKLLSGSEKSIIGVWDVGTGQHTATLVGHDGAVYALAVHEDRLFSSSHDSTIRMWALGTWAMLRKVACGKEQYPRCLAVSGSQLVSGSFTDHEFLADPPKEQVELLVWDLQSLDLQHTLPQPAGTDVLALLAVEGGRWAGVGMDVVVWRRRV